MLPNGETCASCILWELQTHIMARSGARVGKCRRRSPVVTQDPDGRVRTLFPLTSDQDWCGDHAVLDGGDA